MWIECEDAEGIFKVKAFDVKMTLDSDTGFYVSLGEIAGEDSSFHLVVGTSSEHSVQEQLDSRAAVREKLDL